MGHILPVWRRDSVPPENGSIRRQPYRVSEPVSGDLPQLHFAGLIRQNQERLAVRHEPSVSIADSWLAAGLDQPPALPRDDECPAAGNYRDLRTIRRRMGVGQEFD